MKTRVITGIVFTLTAAAFLVPGFAVPMLSLLFFLMVSVACLIELSSVIKLKLPDISQPLITISALGILIPMIPVFLKGSFDWGFITDMEVSSPNKLSLERAEILEYLTDTSAYFLIFFVVFSFFSVIYILSAKGPTKILEAVITPLTSVYIVFPFACAATLLFIIPNGFFWMITAFIAAWVSDVFAFFAGVTLGKHKIVPQISPKKTWEGTIGGIIGTIMIITIWISIVMKGPDIVAKGSVFLVSFGVVTGLITSLTSQLGDWFASAIKRSAGVKDYGSLLPGHGGLLDRFDGVLFAFPTVLAAAIIYYLI